MVEQYPHIMKVSTTPASVRDGNGNWTSGGGTAVLAEAKCRLEFNNNEKNNNRYVIGADGSRIEYSAMIYLQSLDQDKFKLGASVEVYKGSTKLFSNTIKSISPGQLNVRVCV